VLATLVGPPRPDVDLDFALSNREVFGALRSHLSRSSRIVAQRSGPECSSPLAVGSSPTRPTSWQPSSRVALRV
jgi:hypothetical protein